MRLLDLPPELLDLIIDLTAPDGLESFVLSCKAVFRRSKSQAAHHNELKRRWSHTSNAHSSRRGDTLHLLYEISREPIIADYITTLSLWDRRAGHNVDYDMDGHDFRQDPHSMKAIKSLLKSTEHYTGVDSEAWWQLIIEEDVATAQSGMDNLYAAVALLALLSNLKTLQLPDRWFEVRHGEEAEYLVPEVEALIATANRSHQRSQPLSRLETLFPFVEEGYDTRVGLQCLQPFMCLNTIRNLFAVSCVAIQDDWGEVPFQWPDRTLRSPLTRIELASCCMDAGGLSILLANTPAVTVFRYSHQTKWDGLEYDWNAGEFLETLANYCGSQLRELAITVDELHGEVINGLSSFMRFEKLEKLEVDVFPFCGPPLESGQRLGRNAFIPGGQIAWQHIDIPCMGDMLPLSIRELQVNTDYPLPTEQALRSLFKNIKIRKSDKLLHLEKVVIRQYRSNTAQKLADDFGVILEVFDEEMAKGRPRSMMPEWKREFDTIVGGIVMTTA